MKAFRLSSPVHSSYHSDCIYVPRWRESGN
nr:MAG TPA: hypothetical protein [Caudoviricetes sp.]